MQKRTISVPEFDYPRQLAHSNTLLVERRSAIRYLVTLKVEFRWTDSHGVPRLGQGVTRDISPRGTYVLASNCPPRDTKVQIEFELSPEAHELPALQIGAEGSVLRAKPTTSRAGRQGFAVQLRGTRVLTR